MKEASRQISLLIDRFERNIEAYHSPAYNETQLRREFIDPFFEALGWGVANKAGYAEQSVTLPCYQKKGYYLIAYQHYQTLLKDRSVCQNVYFARFDKERFNISTTPLKIHYK